MKKEKEIHHNDETMRICNEMCGVLFVYHENACAGNNRFNMYANIAGSGRQCGEEGRVRYLLSNRQCIII